jgi:transposase
MPWKESTIMEQKIEFICEWRSGNYTITELCRSFEISRPTAYKIIARFENEGYEGLQELSRKPSGIHPNSTDENVVNGILTLKEKHKLWGAKKIHKLLYNDFSDELIPSVLHSSTNILNKTRFSEASEAFKESEAYPPYF